MVLAFPAENAHASALPCFSGFGEIGVDRVTYRKGIPSGLGQDGKWLQVESSAILAAEKTRRVMLEQCSGPYSGENCNTRRKKPM